MIIDIDIKIADHDGSILHRFEKRFDKFEYTDEPLNFNIQMGKSFEEFLSEYMSYSGRIIRERLITGCISGKIPVQTSGAETEAVEKEIEYRIRLGDNKLYTGSFPFSRPVSLQESDPAACPSDKIPESQLSGDANSMTKAIEKYEATFQQSGQETVTSFTGPA